MYKTPFRFFGENTLTPTPKNIDTLPPSALFTPGSDLANVYLYIRIFDIFEFPLVIYKENAFVINQQ